MVVISLAGLDMIDLIMGQRVYHKIDAEEVWEALSDFQLVKFTETDDWPQAVSPNNPYAFVYYPAQKTRMARDFVDTVLVRAFEASKQDQNIIIGIDTSWMPDMQGMQALLNYISRITREKGLENVMVVRGKGKALAGNILKEAERTNTPLSNVVALGEESAIKADAFDKLRSTETDKKAFLVGVDPKNLSDNSYIDLLKMLTLAMKLAFNEIDTVDASGLTATQIGPRTWIFIPEARPMDFEEKKAVYEAQAQALVAA
jgi:hypothetical protein